MGAINTFLNAIKTDQSLIPATLTRDALHRGRRVTPNLGFGSITVGELLKAIQLMPPQSLLLGQCQDGLPFLMDLRKPEIGAILVSSEKGAGKTHQLQVLADSAVRLNSPSDLQIGILTFKPNEWHTWKTKPSYQRYLQGIYAWYDPWASGMIQSLVDLAEARRQGNRLGPNVLVILDDLNFIEELDYEAQVNLHWLLAYGSCSRIWIVGAINAHRATDFRYWVDPFRTRIIGRVSSDKNLEILALRQGSGAKSFDAGEFCIFTREGWQNYRLPLIGD